MNNLKNKLNVKTKTTHHIDWLTYSWVRDKGLVGLDEICADVYGKRIELGSDNDTDHSFDVEKEELADYDQETIDEIIQSGFVEDYNLGIVLTDLCNRDAIDPGSYVITVSW